VIEAREQAREASDPIREFLDLHYVREPDRAVLALPAELAERDSAILLARSTNGQRWQTALTEAK
jgi:hypothetical protein